MRHLAQIIERTAKILVVAEHRKRPRARLLIKRRQFHGVHTGKYIAARRRTTLDFCDDAYPLFAQCVAKRSYPRRMGQTLLDFTQGYAPLAFFNFLSFMINDCVENHEVVFRLGF